MVVEGDDAPVEVDFTPKELLQYKLPYIDLFAPDKVHNLLGNPHNPPEADYHSNPQRHNH